MADQQRPKARPRTPLSENTLDGMAHHEGYVPIALVPTAGKSTEELVDAVMQQFERYKARRKL